MPCISQGALLRQESFLFFPSTFFLCNFRKRIFLPCQFDKFLIFLIKLTVIIAAQSLFPSLFCLFFCLLHLKQEVYECGCPGLFGVIFTDPRQFPQEMGAADCMLYIRIIPIGCPAVMYSDPLESCEHTALPHTCEATLCTDVQIGILTIGGIMDPPEFFIHSGSGFIEMPQTGIDHFLFDHPNRTCHTAGTAFYHVAYRSCSNRDIENTGKDFMDPVYTDSAYRI